MAPAAGSLNIASSATGGARASDGEIGRAVNLFHSMVKSGDVGRNIFPPIIIREQPFVAGAR
jgi:hypothetical protein